jgi:hypothetical protein
MKCQLMWLKFDTSLKKKIKYNKIYQRKDYYVFKGKKDSQLPEANV